MTRKRWLGATCAVILMLATAGLYANYHLRLQSLRSLLECTESGGFAAFACDKAIRMRLAQPEEIAALNQDAGIEHPAFLDDRAKADEYVGVFRRHGVDVDAVASFTSGGTALHLAAGLGQPQAVEILLAHGANPFLRDRKGRLAIDRARERQASAAPSQREDYRRVVALLEGAGGRRQGAR